MQCGNQTGAAIAAAFAAWMSPSPASAQEAGRLPDIVVTATRTEQSAYDVPAAIARVAIEPDAATPGLRLGEFLSAVPGVLARDRQNAAQEEQISIRGFGARSTFGVRGLRLYTDGIPATMPDGQGQSSHFNLGSGQRIEVLRGPYSALYGNSSGGVIQLLSDPFPTERQLMLGAGLGSYGARQAQAALAAPLEGGGYSLRAAYAGGDGYRRHSAAERFLGSARYQAALGPGSLTLLYSGLELPQADDPQGLTQAQFETDPRQAAPAAEQFDTRKSVGQHQAGAAWRVPLDGGHALSLTGYGGRREVLQFLSVPVAAQANPLNSGGVVDLDSRYGGADARWTWNTQLAQRPLELVAGAAWERQDQQRRGHENFVGAQLGVQGALRRDELDRVYSVDEYLQAQWRARPAWTLSAGLRHSQVRFSVDDRYIVAGNPDDSGRLAYDALSPVAGLVFEAAPQWRWYAAYGRGFETPTFNELAYRPDGSGGLNTALRAARSHHGEFGFKHRGDGGLRAEAALFTSLTRDELAVLGSSGGRSTFQSVGRARRRGVEFFLQQPITQDLAAQLALTGLQAQFRSDFANCPTPATCTIPAGSAIPGVPRAQAYAALRWSRPPDWQLLAELQAYSSVPVNDAGSQSAAGHALFGLRANYAPVQGGFNAYLALRNLFDRRHAGSVIVNEANGRYFEPGLPRSVAAGMNWTF